MAVRRAKIQNHADSHAKSPTLLLKSITVDAGDAGDAATVIGLHGGVQLIVGPNGGGKTTLLRAVRESVLGGVSTSPGPLAAHSPQFTSAWSSGGGSCFHIDPALEVSAFLTRVSVDPNWRDLLEGVGESLFNEDELEWASYIIGRTYECITVREVEASNDGTFPYFSASYGGVDFELSAMGLGEVVVFYLIWRLRLTPKRSILFIEEPETHLSWEAQRRLADFLMVKSESGKIQFFVATHSPTIIQQGYCERPIFVCVLPQLLIEHSDGVEKACRKLGAPPHTVRTVLLEDRVAVSVAQELLLYLDPEVSATTGFGYDKRGVSGLISNINIVITKGNPLLLVLDGDQRSKEAAESGHLAYLPGKGSPEATLRKVAEANSEALDGMFGLESTHDVTHDLGGLDDHDWWIAFSRRAGGQAPTIRRLIPLLLADPLYREEAETLVERVKAVRG